MPRSSGQSVRIQIDGRLRTVAVQSYDLTVVSAGICLSGKNSDFEMASIVTVLREQGQERRIADAVMGSHRVRRQIDGWLREAVHRSVPAMDTTTHRFNAATGWLGPANKTWRIAESFGIRRMAVWLRSLLREKSNSAAFSGTNRLLRTSSSRTAASRVRDVVLFREHRRHGRLGDAHPRRLS